MISFSGIETFLMGHWYVVVTTFLSAWWAKVKFDLAKIKAEAKAVVTAVETNVKADVAKLKALL